MSTQTTLHGLRGLGLALIAGLVVCAPVHAHSGGHFGAIGHGGFGWWGWPRYGLFLATVPLYYSTLWWNGMPYYYAYDNYYVWNNGMGGYQAVAPPPHVTLKDVATA